MDCHELLEYQWPYILGCLPLQQLDESACRFGALSRRREVESASTLLRLTLAYGFCGLSLRQTAAWAEAAGIAQLSDVALLNRLRKTAPWLGYLLSVKLADFAPPPRPHSPAHRIRLVDATTVSPPGARSGYYRLHLGFDLDRQAFDHLEVTDQHGGESLTRFTFTPGELVLADRGYSHRKGLASVVAAGADFLVRLSWQLIPLRTLDGAPFDLLSAVREMPEAQPQSFTLDVAAAPQAGLQPLRVRLIAVRRSEAAADQARIKFIREHKHQGKPVHPRTLELAGYVCLLTSLTEQAMGAREALELYRYRWQVELAFKRLKGLLALDALPAKDPALVRTAIYAKLLAALLVDGLTDRYLSFSPWGYRLPGTPAFDLAY